MTGERIERLRQWVKDTAGIEVGFVYSDGILKVLEEREALLKALKRFGKHEAPATYCAHGACHCGLFAAIEKAEAP